MFGLASVASKTNLNIDVFDEEEQDYFSKYYDGEEELIESSLINETSTNNFSSVERLLINKTVEDYLSESLPEDELLVYNMVNYSESNIHYNDFGSNAKLSALKQLTRELIYNRRTISNGILKKFFDCGYTGEHLEELISIVAVTSFTKEN